MLPGVLGELLSHKTHKSLWAKLVSSSVDTDSVRSSLSSHKDVRWFEASYLRAALADKDAADGFNIPSKTSLAHRLITGWLKDVEQQR